MNRIPVFVDGRCIDLVDEARAKRLAKAFNVEAIRRRKDKRIVELRIENYGGDWKGQPKRGDPRKYSHDNETEQNPNCCWTLRHLPKSTASLYRLAVTDCLTKAA
jgi:hypothetical protein